jgi:hypothetical protein
MTAAGNRLVAPSTTRTHVKFDFIIIGQLGPPLSHIIRIDASFKFRAVLMLKGQQARLRGYLVHADAPICSKHAFEHGKVAASATAISTITRAPSVWFKIRLHLYQ